MLGTKSKSLFNISQISKVVVIRVKATRPGEGTNNNKKKKMKEAAYWGASALNSWKTHSR